MTEIEVLETPIKSEGDKKNYRLIKLQNGLKALLVNTQSADGSESEENVAAVSLTVAVGSFHQNSKIGGLAHFLEHMLFMGNKKYPIESGFNDFVSANGGKRNAQTSGEYTMYFFDIMEEFLAEGIDRFAQMFISPLLSSNAMQRERESVDSEYQMAVSMEFVHIWALNILLFSETNPAKAFSIGSLRSLKDDTTDEELQQALKDFFKKYVANKMYLCVQSKQTLDEIQAMVVDNFSQLPSSNDAEVQSISEFNFHNLVKSDFHEKMFYLKPRLAKRSLVLTWILPPQLLNHTCKPQNHVGRIFDNEGDGGIISYLKNRNLINNFEMHYYNEGFDFNRHFTLTRVLAEMTDYGMENIESILEAIFSYLLMIKETPIDEHRRLFEQENREIEKAFKFHEEKSPFTNVMNLGKGFIYNKDVDVLRSSLSPEFNEQAIMEIINGMNEMNFCLMIVSDKHENFPFKDTLNYGTEYDVADFPESYRKLWENRKLNSKFYLKATNPYEVTNFDIKVNQDESQEYPVEILSNEQFNVWHKLDAKFNKPNVEIKISVLIPKYIDSAYNETIFKVFTTMFTDHAKKKFFQAFDAGLNATLSSVYSGIDIHFYGYNEKIEHFIDMYTLELRNYTENLSETVFEQFRAKIKMDLVVSIKKIVDLGVDYSLQTIYEKFYTDDQILALMDQISYEDVQKYVVKAFAKLKFKMLALGNITRDETLRITSIIGRNFISEPIDQTTEFKRRIHQLPNGKSIIRIKSLMEKDDNSFIYNFYQIGKATKKNVNLIALLESFIDPKAYDYLRSKQQLGYAVQCFRAAYEGTLTFSLLLQSQEHKHKFTEVQEKMHEFMSSIIKSAVDELSDEEFLKLKEARVKKLQSEVLTLREEFGRYWKEIQDEYYIFNRYQLYIDVTKELTKAEFQNIFNSMIDPAQQRLYYIHVIGDENYSNSNGNDLKVEFINEKYSDDENIIHSLEDFKKNMFLYPIIKSIE